jgi:hypothetical protein
LAGEEEPDAYARGTQAREAQAAVADAKAAVKAAAEHRALWTTAELALTQAQAALEKGNYTTAQRLAEFAAEQARLGIAQTGYKHFQ